MGFAIHHARGTVIHTGDFKFDHTPPDGTRADLGLIAEWGKQGVDFLLSDSTRAEREGYTLSEATVGESLRQLIGAAQGRVIMATFASNIGRVQQAIDAAAEHGRKVVLIGRSMEQNAAIATELGYLDGRDGTVVGKDQLQRLKPTELMVVTTGSQGEPMSGLTRMSNRDHRNITVVPGDTVILSASPIPGNEEAVARTIDNLFKEGAMVHYEPMTHCHVSGHGSREELKLMLGLAKPRHFIPVHGEYRMLVQHALLAEGAGVAVDRIFVLQNGQVVEFDGQRARLAGSVPGRRGPGRWPVGGGRRGRRHPPRPSGAGHGRGGDRGAHRGLGHRPAGERSRPHRPRVPVRPRRPAARGGARPSRLGAAADRRGTAGRTGLPEGQDPRRPEPLLLREDPPPTDDPAHRARGLRPMAKARSRSRRQKRARKAANTGIRITRRVVREVGAVVLVILALVSLLAVLTPDEAAGIALWRNFLETLLGWGIYFAPALLLLAALLLWMRSVPTERLISALGVGIVTPVAAGPVPARGRRPGIDGRRRAMGEGSSGRWCARRWCCCWA